MKRGILEYLSPFAKLLFLFLLVICCFILLSFAGVLLAIPLFHINLFNRIDILMDIQNPAYIGILKYLQMIQSVSLFIVPALLAGFLFGKSPANYLGIKKKASVSFFIATFLILFVGLPFINWLSSINEMMKLPESMKAVEQWMKDTEGEAAKITDAFLNVKTLSGLSVNILMIAIIPAIGEELFFRGVMQRIFSDWFKNMHVAIFFTAFLFAAIHMQFYGMLPRMMLGVLFGYLYYWTGSLWVPVFAHFLNNGAAVIVSYLSSRGFISSGYEDLGATNNFFLIAGSIVFTGFLLFMVYQKGKINTIHS